MRARENENEGEIYQVRTGSELAGVVSEWVLTYGGDTLPHGNLLAFDHTVHLIGNHTPHGLDVPHGYVLSSNVFPHLGDSQFEISTSRDKQMTDRRFDSLDPLQHPMNHRCRVTYRLRRSIGPVIVPVPVEHAHTDQLEEDIILVLPWNPKAELFANPDHVPPQGVVAIGLPELISPPLLLIKALRIWSPVQHPDSNL